MSTFHRIAGAAVFAAVFASIVPSALALPPVGTDPPEPPPTSTPIRPLVRFDTPRETVDLAAIRVSGRAVDSEEPATALTVKITIDGQLVKIIKADQPDPPVATPNARAAVPPPVQPGHSFDLVIPNRPAGQTLCVIVVNVGPTGSDVLACKAIDRVVEFAGRSISYDLDHLRITDAALDSLDRVTNTNSTNVQQSTTISGEKTVTDTQGWSNTYGRKVTMSAGVKIPFISGGVTVEGSSSWVKNGSTTTTRKFAWSQPVLVPPKSKVVATVAVTKTTLTVPYTLAGDYVYAGGTRVAGLNGGTFTGVNGHDLEVTLTQFDLDGTPAAKPVPQPEANFLSGV